MDKTLGKATSSSVGRGEIDNTDCGALSPSTEWNHSWTSSVRASQGRTVPELATGVQPAQHLFTGTRASHITPCLPRDRHVPSFNICEPPWPFHRSWLGDHFTPDYGSREEGAIPKIKQSWMTARRGPSMTHTRTRSEMGDAACFVATTVDTTASKKDKSGVTQEMQPHEDSTCTAYPTASQGRTQSHRKKSSRAPTSSWSSSVAVEVQGQASRKQDRAKDLGPSTSKSSKPPPEANYHADFNSVQVSSAVTLESPVYDGDDDPESNPRPPAQKRSLMIDISFANDGVDEDKSMLRHISMNVEKIIGRLLHTRLGERKKTTKTVPEDTMSGEDITENWSVDASTRVTPEAGRLLPTSRETKPDGKLETAGTTSEAALVMGTDTTTAPVATPHKKVKKEKPLTTKPLAKKRESLRPSDGEDLTKADSGGPAPAVPSSVPRDEKQHQEEKKEKLFVSKSYGDDDTTVTMEKEEKKTPREKFSSNGMKERKSSLKPASKEMPAEPLVAGYVIPEEANSSPDQLEEAQKPRKLSLMTNDTLGGELDTRQFKKSLFKQADGTESELDIIKISSPEEKERERVIEDEISTTVNKKKKRTKSRSKKGQKETKRSKDRKLSKGRKEEDKTETVRRLTSANEEEESLEKKPASRMQRENKPKEERRKLEEQPPRKKGKLKKKSQSKESTSKDEDKRTEKYGRKKEHKSVESGQTINKETATASSVAKRVPSSSEIVKSGLDNSLDAFDTTLSPIKGNTSNEVSPVASLPGTSAATPDGGTKIPVTAMQPSEQNHDFPYSTKGKGRSSVGQNEEMEAAAVAKKTTKRMTDRRPSGKHPRGKKDFATKRGERTELEQLDNQQDFDAFPGSLKTDSSFTTLHKAPSKKESPFKIKKDNRSTHMFTCSTEQASGSSSPRRGIFWSTQVLSPSSWSDYGDANKPLVWCTDRVGSPAPGTLMSKQRRSDVAPLPAKHKKKKKRKKTDGTRSDVLALQSQSSTTGGMPDARDMLTTSDTQSPPPASSIVISAPVTFTPATTIMSELPSGPPASALRQELKKTDDEKTPEPRDQNGERTKLDQGKHERSKGDKKVKTKKRSKNKASRRSKKGSKTKNTEKTESVIKREKDDKGKTRERQKMITGEAKAEEGTTGENIIDTKVKGIEKVIEGTLQEAEGKEFKEESPGKKKKERHNEITKEAKFTEGILSENIVDTKVQGVEKVVEEKLQEKEEHEDTKEKQQKLGKAADSKGLKGMTHTEENRNNENKEVKLDKKPSKSKKSKRSKSKGSEKAKRGKGGQKGKKGKESKQSKTDMAGKAVQEAAASKEDKTSKADTEGKAVEETTVCKEDTSSKPDIEDKAIEETAASTEHKKSKRLKGEKKRNSKDSRKQKKGKGSQNGKKGKKSKESETDIEVKAVQEAKPGDESKKSKADTKGKAVEETKASKEDTRSKADIEDNAIEETAAITDHKKSKTPKGEKKRKSKDSRKQKKGKWSQNGKKGKKNKESETDIEVKAVQEAKPGDDSKKSKADTNGKAVEETKASKEDTKSKADIEDNAIEETAAITEHKKSKRPKGERKIKKSKDSAKEKKGKGGQNGKKGKKSKESKTDIEGKVAQETKASKDTRSEDDIEPKAIEETEASKEHKKSKRLKGERKRKKSKVSTKEKKVKGGKNGKKGKRIKESKTDLEGQAVQETKASKVDKKTKADTESKAVEKTKVSKEDTRSKADIEDKPVEETKASKTYKKSKRLKDERKGKKSKDSTKEKKVKGRQNGKKRNKSKESKTDIEGKAVQEPEASKGHKKSNADTEGKAVEDTKVGKEYTRTKSDIEDKAVEETKASKKYKKSKKLKSERKGKESKESSKVKKGEMGVKSTSTKKSEKRKKSREKTGSTKSKSNEVKGIVGKRMRRSKSSMKRKKSKAGKEDKGVKPDTTGKHLKKKKKRSHKKSKTEVVVFQSTNQTAGRCCLLLSVICFVLAGISLLLYFVLSPVTATTETATSTMSTAVTFIPGNTTPTDTSTLTPGVGISTSYTIPKVPVTIPGTGTTSGPSPPTLSSAVPTTSPTVSPHVPSVYFCNTRYCNEEGSYLKSLLSSQTKPCDNFYDYVCDAWEQQNPREAKTSTGSLVSRDTQLQDSLAQQVLRIIPNAPDDVLIATELHSSCADRSKAGTAVAYARDMFSKWSIREWPFFSSGQETITNVWSFAAELIRDMNFATLAVLTVGINPTDLHGSIVELDMPQFLLSNVENGFDDVTRLFRAAIKETAKAINPAAPHDLVDRVMAVFIAFGSIPREFRDARRGFDSVEFKNMGKERQVFLEKLFPSVIGKGPNFQIVLRSPRYFKQLLPGVLTQLSLGDVLNYMGFVVLVEVAPFFPEGLRDLRGLFARSVLGRPVADLGDSSVLCLRAVEKLLPGCFSKASWLLLESTGNALIVREWITQLESIFRSRVRHLAWFDELSALLVRYRLKRHPVTLFGPNNRPCAPLGQFSTESPRLFFFQVGKHEHDSRREAINANEAVPRNHFAASDLNTWASYDPERTTVRVPMALLNLSVSPKSTMFAFHLSRFAVRFYKALVQVLSESFYERDVQMSFSQDSRRVLGDLVRCLTDGIQGANLHGYSSLDKSNLPEALLDQTMALQLSLKAFHELLHVRRIWNLDFKFTNLPELSAEQLFFVYYALDNCESTDAVYDAKLQNTLPARYRVNLPLMHLDEFSAAFNCRDLSDPAQPRAAVCRLFANANTTRKRAKSRRLFRPHSELMSMLGL